MILLPAIKNIVLDKAVLLSAGATTIIKKVAPLIESTPDQWKVDLPVYLLCILTGLKIISMGIDVYYKFKNKGKD